MANTKYQSGFFASNMKPPPTFLLLGGVLRTSPGVEEIDFGSLFVVESPLLLDRET